MKKIVRFSYSVCIFALLVFANSCNDHSINEETNEKVLQKSNQLVPISGGEITIPEVVDINFENNTFAKATNVTISQIESDVSLNRYHDEVVKFYGIDENIGYFIKIETSNNPKKDVIVKLKIPDNFLSRIKTGYALEVLALLNQSVDEELISFDVVKSRFISSLKELEVTIPAYYFDIKQNGESYETVLTVSTIIGSPKNGKILATGNCGFYLRCPLAGCTVRSHFDLARPHPTLRNRDGSPVIRPHRGVDYAAASNTEVYAAYNGTVIDTSTLRGYGRIITIEHVNTANQRVATRYAHLNSFEVSEGDVVEEGDLIGLSGMTGGISSGPHLHFEYFTNSNTADYSGLVDPVPFVNTNNIRLISASAELVGINNCLRYGETASSWKVKLDYKDPSNTITNKAILSFEDVEPFKNPIYTTTVGALKQANGVVESPIFCARFSGYPFLKIKVYLTLENGSQSNCINFILSRTGNAQRLNNFFVKSHEVPRSNLNEN